MACSDKVKPYFKMISCACSAVDTSGQAGPDADHIQRVADDIRQHNREYSGRLTEFAKPAALYCRKPFADGIDLRDIRSARQQAAS